MKINFSENINLKSLSPQTEFEEKVISFLEEWFSVSETLCVQTSGSTGKPKTFEVEKQRMLSSAKMTCDFLGLKKGNTAFLCLPTEYISGKMMIVRSIERKLELTIANPTSKPLVSLERKMDFCAMSPLQVENSLDKIHLIKKVIIGGAHVSDTLVKKIEQHSVTSNLQPPTSSIYETYGMSETLSHIALKEIFPKSDDYFRVLKDVEISLDERKCLHVFAPKLNPEILKTNDLVELKNQKEFRFLGRLDNVINSAGLKIHPEELENLVKKELGKEVVFLGIKDEKLGQKLVLIIEGEESEITNKQLSSINYPTKNHRPKEVVYIQQLPRIPNGKINRMELSEIIMNK